MRRALGLLTIALLSLFLGACAKATGHAGSSGSAPSSATSSTGAPKRDRDNDGDNNDDDAKVLYYGNAPSAVERQAIVTLVSDYYAAGAAEDGAMACSLLMPFLAESVVEDYRHQPGLEGETCATVLSKLFKQHHSQLSGQHATLKFISVRVSGDRALTVQSFSTLPEVRQLAERREGNGKWKLLQVFDGILE
jgi:hypothetical protein